MINTFGKAVLGVTVLGSMAACGSAGETGMSEELRGYAKNGITKEVFTEICQPAFAAWKKDTTPEGDESPLPQSEQTPQEPEETVTDTGSEATVLLLDGNNFIPNGMVDFSSFQDFVKSEQTRVEELGAAQRYSPEQGESFESFSAFINGKLNETEESASKSAVPLSKVTKKSKMTVNKLFALISNCPAKLGGVAIEGGGDISKNCVDAKRKPEECEKAGRP